MPVPGKTEVVMVAVYPGNPTSVSTNTFDVPLGTLVVDYSTPAIWQKTTALGDNSGYSGVVGSTFTAPLISGGLTASGSAANTFAGSTGTFITSTGANTLSGTTTVAANKNLLCATGTSLFDFSLGTGIFKTTTGAGTFGCSSNTFTNALTMGTATQGLVLKQGANGLCGTFVCNGATPVTVSNTNVAISDAIIVSLNTVGGTVGAVPAVKTITAATGFTIAGTASDTSTYNYSIVKNAA